MELLEGILFTFFDDHGHQIVIPIISLRVVKPLHSQDCDSRGTNITSQEESLSNSSATRGVNKFGSGSLILMIRTIPKTECPILNSSHEKREKLRNPLEKNFPHEKSFHFPDLLSSSVSYKIVIKILCFDRKL